MSHKQDEDTLEEMLAEKTDEEESESEFGKGYTICLAQFCYHEPRLQEWIGNDRIMQIWEEIEGTKSKAVNRGLEMWFSGASDHFYDLQRPFRINDRDWQTAHAISHRALSIGHGWHQEREPITYEETIQMIEVAGGLVYKAARQVGMPMNTFDDLMAIDRKLGLEPVRGTWTCETLESHQRWVEARKKAELYTANMKELELEDDPAT